MPTKHRVRQGETLATIATSYGFLPGVIWDDSENEELRQRRGSPSALTPGDELMIPDITLRQESVATGERHRVKVKLTRFQTVRLKLRDALGEALANVEYTLEIPGQDDVEGTTDGEGLVEAQMPHSVKTAQLHILDDTFRLIVSGVNAVSSVTGVQQRLNNLGFAAGRIDDRPGERTRDALMRFQEAEGLEVTGLLDAQTRDKLEEKHDGVANSADPDVEDEAPPDPEVDDSDAWDDAVEDLPPIRQVDLEEEED